MKISHVFFACLVPLAALQANAELSAKAGFKWWHLEKQNSRAVFFQAQARLRAQDLSLQADLVALGDLDFKQRQYALLKELNLAYDTPNATFFAGKKVFFFGSLESYNPSDIVNKQNRKKDIFAKEKLGADVAGADVDLGAFELLALVKFHKERNEFLAKNFPAPPVKR